MSTNETDDDGSGTEVLRESDQAHRSEELLRRLYLEEKMSANEIADELNCAASTVLNWLHRHDIPVRTNVEGQRIKNLTATFQTHAKGHEVWWTAGDFDGQKHVYVHRLLAVAEYGVDAVDGMVVHHKNDIKWDNRPSNLELMTASQHNSHHKKVTGWQRARIAELYELGDISSRDLANHLKHDITQNTVLNIHDECYGGGASA